MLTIDLTVSEAMKSFIDDQVASGDFATTTEYIHALVNEDHRRTAESRLEALLIEGLESGPPVVASEEYWRKNLSDGLDRHRKAADRAAASVSERGDDSLGSWDPVIKGF